MVWGRVVDQDEEAVRGVYLVGQAVQVDVGRREPGISGDDICSTGRDGGSMDVLIVLV